MVQNASCVGYRVRDEARALEGGRFEGAVLRMSRAKGSG